MRFWDWTLCIFLGAGVVAAGCSAADGDDQAGKTENVPSGAIHLGLDVAPGVTVDVISYDITAPDIQTISGTLDVSNISGPTFSAIIAGVPAGSGRTLSLTAQSSDGGSCTGEATFDVIADEAVTVQIVLQCRGPGVDAGSVIVDGTVNRCPSVSSVSAVPASAPVGGTIQVSAAASDPEGGATEIEWTADSGSFADPTSASTTYLCEAPGTHALTATASDDGDCTDSISVEVVCEGDGAAVCGNGVVEEGEECDDGNVEDGDGCSASCTIETQGPVCGNGVVENGEECDDGNVEDGDGCSANCTLETQAPVCGNGVVENGEECDDGNVEDGDGCSANCTLETQAPVCGNGVVENGEECDDGNVEDGDGCSANCTLETQGPECGNGVVENGEECDDGNLESGDGCSSTCLFEGTCGPTEAGTETDACVACTCEACPGAIEACFDATDETADGVSKAVLCESVVECGQTSGCTGIDCYCGTADVLTCLMGGGNGPCKAEIEAAAESTDVATILERQTAVDANGDLIYAVGRASAVSDCTTASCSAECL